MSVSSFLSNAPDTEPALINPPDLLKQIQFLSAGSSGACSRVKLTGTVAVAVVVPNLSASSVVLITGVDYGASVAATATGGGATNNCVQYLWGGVLPTVAVNASTNTITFTGATAGDNIYIYYLIVG